MNLKKTPTHTQFNFKLTFRNINGKNKNQRL